LNKLFKGIRFRLTLVYSTLFGLFICIFAYIITSQYYESGREDFDSGLINFALDLSEYLKIDDAGLKIDFNLPPSEIKKAFPFILNQAFYAVRSSEGKIMAKSLRVQEFIEIPYNNLLPLRSDYTHRFLSFVHRDETYRAVNLKITNNRGEVMILQVASSLTTLEERERNHQIITLLIIPLFIMCSSFFSYLIAGNALNPIKSLTDAANNIAAKNLSLRVPEFSTGDEVEELSKTLNTLLARLEKSFTAQENFVANASHQLNTPLAIIKGELDVLESKERSVEEIKRFQKSLREELERLIDLVKNMLLISRVESGQENFVFNPVRLDDLLLGVTSRLRIKAREKKITMRFNIDETLSEKDLEVMGEKPLLDSLFENIIDNAIKYSPDESTVELNIKKINHKLEVWIQDEGPGMDQDNFQEIIHGRYQRGTQIHIPGTGIGLSIANKIAHSHHAQIIHQPKQPHGSHFIVRFS
jgi:signal transduction histidine kinase